MTSMMTTRLQTRETASPTPRYWLPPRLTTAGGEPRGVGVELEFAGLGPAETSRRLARVFGGQPRARTPAACVVESTSIGALQVEYDARALHRERYSPLLERLGLEVDESRALQAAEKLAVAVASTVVPLEITTAPIPITELEVLDTLTATLREAGAAGTEASPLYAFALHLNPTIPSLETDCVLRHLRAFALLEPLLRALMDIDSTRRLSGYATAYPDEYLERLLAPAYTPSRDALVRDYLAANPTRNRSLDLLPALAMIDESMVRDAMDEPGLLNPRPAFHYRLPDCRIDDPGWSVAYAWNLWVEVERVAADPARLERLMRQRATRASSSWPEHLALELLGRPSA